MSPPVDRWITGDVAHSSERWTLAEVLAELFHLTRGTKRIKLTETVTRTIEIEVEV